MTSYVAQYSTAVVILSYNSIKWHELFLPKIVSEGVEKYDVVVIDHASTEDTSRYIKEKFPTVHLITLTENHGFAWGYAEGLKRISAKYYVLLSSDFEVTDNWLMPLQNKMESDKQISALQPIIRYYKDRPYFEYAGAAGGFMDKFGYLFCRGRIFDTLEKDVNQYNDDIEIFWASGGCLMVRSDIYHELGGLDPDFYAHMEEVDLCWRMKNAGYKVGVVTESKVFHVGGSIISYGSPQKTFYNFRNSYWLFCKNETSSKLMWLIPIRLMLDGIAGLQFLLKGQLNNVAAIIKAHFSFYGSIPILIKKRKDLSVLKSKNPNKNGIYNGNILLDYFINKKRYFSELKFLTKRL